MRSHVARILVSDLKRHIHRIVSNHAGARLNLSRPSSRIAAALLALTLSTGFEVVRAQSATANSTKSDNQHRTLQFDVVSIKPTSPGFDRTLIQQPPDGTSFRGAPARMVLETAFGVEDDRIIGAPSWINTNRYDIEAKVAPDDAPRLEKLKAADRNAMLLPLLAERFNLKYHHETRERATYALVVARGGPRLTKGEPFPSGGPKPPDPDHPEDPAKEHFKIMTVPGHIEADSVPMDILADQLTRLHAIGRPVVDKTGLSGNYNFSLRWTPDNPLPPMLDAYPPGSVVSGLAHAENPTDAAPESPLFTAIQEQLGLKLLPEKSSVDVIVIDHIDPPSPN